MLDAAKATGKQLMIAQNQRLEPAHVKAREIIQSGELENLVFHNHFGHPGCEYWRLTEKHLVLQKRDCWDGCFRRFGGP